MCIHKNSANVHTHTHTLPLSNLVHRTWIDSRVVFFNLVQLMKYFDFVLSIVLLSCLFFYCSLYVLLLTHFISAFILYTPLPHPLPKHSYNRRNSISATNPHL